MFVNHAAAYPGTNATGAKKSNSLEHGDEMWSPAPPAENINAILAYRPLPVRCLRICGPRHELQALRSSWYSSSVLTAQMLPLSVRPAMMLSTAVMAVSME